MTNPITYVLYKLDPALSPPASSPRPQRRARGGRMRRDR
jgi:hypothetical protein